MVLTVQKLVLCTFSRQNEPFLVTWNRVCKSKPKQLSKTRCFIEIVCTQCATVSLSCVDKGRQALWWRQICRTAGIWISWKLIWILAYLWHCNQPNLFLLSCSSALFWKNALEALTVYHVLLQVPVFSSRWALGNDETTSIQLSLFFSLPIIRPPWACLAVLLWLYWLHFSFFPLLGVDEKRHLTKLMQCVVGVLLLWYSPLPTHVYYLSNLSTL